MTLSELWQDILALIPIAGFAAAIVAAVVYVRYKGTVDALRETAETYERLAKAAQEEAQSLREEVTKLEKRVEELSRRMELQAQQSAAFDRMAERFTTSLVESMRKLAER